MRNSSGILCNLISNNKFNQKLSFFFLVTPGRQLSSTVSCSPDVLDEWPLQTLHNSRAKSGQH